MSDDETWTLSLLGPPWPGDIHKPRGQLRGGGLAKLPFYYISKFCKSDHKGGERPKIPKNKTTRTFEGGSP